MTDSEWMDALRRANPTPIDDPVQQHRTERLLMQHTTTTAPTATPRPSRRAAFAVALPMAVAAIAAFMVLPSNRELEPIRIGTLSGAPKVAESALAGNAADMRLAAPIEFRLAPGVGIENEDRRVYRYAEATEQAIRRLADRFGVAEPLERSVYGENVVSYSTTDGFYAAANGSFSWSNNALYASPEFQSRISMGCAVAEPALPPSASGAVAASPVEPCVPITPSRPMTRPSDAAAHAAIEPFLFGARATVAYRTDYSVAFTLTYGPDGVDAYTGYAEVADVGLLGISGVFTELEDMGKYPTATVEAAVQRLADTGFLMARVHSTAPTSAAVMDDTAATVETATGSSQEPAVIDPTPSGAIDPVLCAPDMTVDGNTSTTGPGSVIGCAYQEPIPNEPMVIELTAVEWTTALLADATDRLWVVPAYRFTDATGGVYTAVALAEEYMQQVQPNVVQGDTPAATPIPADPGTPAGQPDQPTLVDSARFVGLTEQGAVELAAELGLTIRVAERDGELFAGTMDYRTDRVNLYLTAGMVREATIG